MTDTIPQASRRQRNDGVRTIEQLQSRCEVHEETGCWIWQAGREHNGRPKLWLPEWQQNVSLGMVACFLRTGERPAKGVIWHCFCKTRHCANPMHRKPGNRSSQMKAAKLRRTDVARLKVAATKRAASHLTDEDAAAIRESAEHADTLAQRYRISASYVRRIRSRKARQPLLARTASIFSMGSYA